MNKWLSITKPGIIFGNVITVCGGYFLASTGHVNVVLLLATLIGMSLVMACGCTINNVIDRDIDPLMSRTQNRPIPKGEIKPMAAMVYAIVLGILGLVLLYWQTTLAAFIAAAIGLFVYVVLYSLWSKRHSTWGTVIGGIAGAVPPVVGYCAVINHFNVIALSLFAILFFWQMPHAYAIALFRLKEYAAANIPVLPIKRGIPYTKAWMLIYLVPYTIAAIMPTILHARGWLYGSVALVLALIWIIIAISGFKAEDDRAWARKMFFFSIINITVLFIVMALPFA